MSLEYLFYFEGEAPEDEAQVELLALRLWVGEAFVLSQEYCPVISGRLQRSGGVVSESDAEAIVYLAPYASVVEFGKGEPGEKGYFPGRFYVGRAVDETEELFEEYLVGLLSGDFIVEEV